jgi:hypothetical protein
VRWRVGVLSMVVAAVVPVVSPGSSQEIRRWNLGSGFVATIYAPQRDPGDPEARRTLVIQKQGHTIRRFSRQDEGLGAQVGEATGDQIKDVLVLDYYDGSGGCGEYRLFGGPQLAMIWRRFDCADTGIARLWRGALTTWVAVGSSKTAASKGGIHCCWSVWRRTQWRWHSGRLVRGSSVLGPPPSASWRVRLLPGTSG